MKERRSEGAQRDQAWVLVHCELQGRGAEGSSERAVTAQTGWFTGTRLLEKGRRSLLSHLGPWVETDQLGQRVLGRNGTQVATVASGHCGCGS